MTIMMDPWRLTLLMATDAGDARFNAVFPNYLSKSYKDSSIAFYTRFKTKGRKD